MTKQEKVKEILKILGVYEFLENHSASHNLVSQNTDERKTMVKKATDFLEYTLDYWLTDDESDPSKWTDFIAEKTAVEDLMENVVRELDEKLNQKLIVGELQKFFQGSDLEKSSNIQDQLEKLDASSLSINEYLEKRSKHQQGQIGRKFYSLLVYLIDDVLSYSCFEDTDHNGGQEDPKKGERGLEFIQPVDSTPN